MSCVVKKEAKTPKNLKNLSILSSFATKKVEQNRKFHLPKITGN